MIDFRVIDRLRRSGEWLALEEHIRQTIDALDTVADIEGDERSIAIEVFARKRAREVLIKILVPFVEYRDMPDPERLTREKAIDAGL